MTRIRGSIIKVDEVSKLGYSQPITQKTNHFSLNTGALAAGITTYNLPNPPAGKSIIVKKISATCRSVANIHQIYLVRLPDNANFFNSLFYEGYEWTIGDVSISPGETWNVSIFNNTAGATFTINVYWIEI